MPTNTQLARRFFAEQDRLRGGPATELCAPNYTAHLANNPSMDLAGHQAFARMFYTGFPDLRHDITSAITEGDVAAVRFTLYGTHTGPFLDLPITGRRIAVTASVMMRMESGNIAELWGEFDQLGLVRQLTTPRTEDEQALAQGI
jgi:predicted ester cyclase